MNLTTFAANGQWNQAQAMKSASVYQQLPSASSAR